MRLLLDEFANIGQIPKFDKLIATIRSREISASIILQSQSQLKTIYKDAAETIIGNCDHHRQLRYSSFSGRKGRQYRKLIRENIDYDSLVIVYSYDRELIDGIVDLILETVLCRQEYILIASNQYPASVVKSKFLKLNYSHIEYVLSCLRRNTSKVNNIKKYLLAALLNAPSTIDGYYQAEVQHDMPELAVRR